MRQQFEYVRWNEFIKTENSTTEDIGEEMSHDHMTEAQKRVSESPVSVAASDSSSTRPNKRKRKGTAPTRHVQVRK